MMIFFIFIINVQPLFQALNIIYSISMYILYIYFIVLSNVAFFICFRMITSLNITCTLLRIKQFILLYTTAMV